MFFIINLRKDFLITGLGLIMFCAALLAAHNLGQGQEKVPALSAALTGCVIVVDAGHGGVDSGAIGFGGSLEKDITLNVALQTAEHLRQCGAEVILTRDGDHDLAGADFNGTIRQRKQRDMPARIAVAEEAHANFFISIHTNASTSRRWRGAQVFYQNNSEIGQTVAKCMQTAINELDKNNTRSAAPGAYYVLNRTSMPGVLIETGFISNPEEERLLLSPEYQDRLAWAIAVGMHQALTSGGD
ncbi:MAG: N-acetylmuramoyl-L-alanine amidase [Syntrophomonadaceae bacterium]|nr:N-acetylmuramoyl-L-alanine amidase [Syntrophomonadaceae bacterium]